VISIPVATYCFVPTFRKAKFCGVPSGVIVIVGCAAGKTRLLNADVGVYTAWRFADGVCSCCDEVKLCVCSAASKEPTVYPQVTYESGETQWNDIDRRKPKEPCPSATLSITSSLWTGLCGVRMATNRLSHGTAFADAVSDTHWSSLSAKQTGPIVVHCA
jgi:hypothetical protein